MERYRDKVIVGVDILPGYSCLSRNTQPHYAVVFIKNGQIINAYEDISFSRLIRLIWEHDVDIIAVDNIFELAENTGDLIKLVKILPSKTKIVQVTGPSSSGDSLESTARSMGLEIRGKPSPLDTAYLSAMIAYRGGGAVVKLVEERCKIIVSKSRSVAQGGMSLNRYRRSIRAGILAITKEIRRILESNGLDYDLIFRKSSGGLEKSIFIVYAPREKLYGLIKPVKNKNVRITIKPIYRDKMVFEEKESGKVKRGLIIGIDPGVSTAVAILDLDGKPLYLYSSRNIDRSEIVNIISRYGIPVIVATDKQQPPEMVRKIATSLNAKIYAPDQDLTNNEKQEIIEKIKKMYPDIEIRDNHVRDSLAAAYKAYLWISDKLSFIDQKLKELDHEIDRESIRINVIMGKTFAEALEDELASYLNTMRTVSDRSIDKDIIQKPLREYMESFSRKIQELRSRIRYLEKTIDDLRRELLEKDSVIEDLKMELKIMKTRNIVNEEYERRIYMLNQENNSLRESLDRERNRIEFLEKKISELEKIIDLLLSGEYIAVPYMTNLNASALKKRLSEARCGLIYVDEIYPIDQDAINILRNNRVAVATSRDHHDLYRELRVPIINITEKILYRDLAIVKHNTINEVEKYWSIIDKLNSDDEYYRIINLIKKYQEERLKKLRDNI